MPAKKIVCLIEDLNSGGAERQLTGLAILLKQSGYNVEVWTYYPGDFYLHDLVDAGVKYRYIASAQNKFRRISVLRKELGKFNPDTVIAYLDTACIIACIIKLLGGKFNLIVSERNTTQKLTIKERLKFFGYRFADTIVCNSFSQGKFIKCNYKNIDHKTLVITNMIDADKFCPYDNMGKCDIDEDGILRVITVARIAHQKNVINYLEALAILKTDGIQAKFDWYGCPESIQYLNEVLSKRHVLGLDNYIEFHVKGTKDIAKEYHKSTHFCLPSAYEGFPNVLCEAMASGLVCSASNVCDNPLILNDSTLLFDPYIPIDIANVLKRSLLFKNQERCIIGQQNRAVIIDMCSSESFKEKYINLIER